MADPAPETLLALLAVKLLGGKDVPEKAEALKALKKFIQPAIDAGWIAKGEFHPLDRKGKPKAAVAVISVTAAGEEHLQRSSTPEAATVLAHSRLAEEQKRHAEEQKRHAEEEARVTEFRQALEADRAALREQILAAVRPTSKKETDLEKSVKPLLKNVDDLLKKVGALAGGLSKLEATVGGNPADVILAKIDSAFQTLSARLAQTGTSPPSPSAAVPVPTAPPAPSPQPHLRDVLRTAYDKRCLFVGNEDGVIKLADLYAEAKKTRPDLTVEAMHRELRSLWEGRELELSVLNEVHDASEPDKEKGIWRDGKLYYFIYWKRP